MSFLFITVHTSVGCDGKWKSGKLSGWFAGGIGPAVPMGGSCKRKTIMKIIKCSFLCHFVIHTGNHEEELKTLKERSAEQNQQLLNLKMELESKDGQLELLEKELISACKTNAESLISKSVPNYFHYNTGFTYNQFNNLCSFFKVPNHPDFPRNTYSSHIQKGRQKNPRHGLVYSVFTHTNETETKF